jgi:hypothetical protein
MLPTIADSPRQPDPRHAASEVVSNVAAGNDNSDGNGDKVTSFLHELTPMVDEDPTASSTPGCLAARAGAPAYSTEIQRWPSSSGQPWPMAPIAPAAHGLSNRNLPTWLTGAAPANAPPGEGDKGLRAHGRNKWRGALNGITAANRFSGGAIGAAPATTAHVGRG